jgi:MEMO1 family protein
VVDSRTLLIISSDFCHWGDNFDYFYLSEKLDTNENIISKQIEKLDRQGIDHITNLNPDGFRQYLEETENTICGS